VGELITEEDVTLLESLADITCSYADDFTSFTLSFAFNDNEYFSNTVSDSRASLIAQCTHIRFHSV
jgi:nucleosome assembly protein 1-like 1